MSFQECTHLILVADAAVMFLLILNVSDHGVHAGPADAEARIAFLPGELRTALTLMNPSRRVRFDGPNKIRQRNSCRHVNENMNVVGDSTDGNPSATNVLDDSANVGEAFRRKVAIEVGKPVLGAEDDMCE